MSILASGQRDFPYNSNFSSEARKEAIRDGVPPIELVDGDTLIEMLENLELGMVPLTLYEVDERF